MIRRNYSAVLLALALSLAALLACAAPALAAPAWVIHSSSNTTAAPGSSFDYVVSVRNVGDTTVLPDNPLKLKVTLPPGITGVSMDSGFTCTTVLGETTFECEGATFVQPELSRVEFSPIVEVSPSAVPGEVLTARFEIEGGGASASDVTFDPIRISETTPEFGIEAFDAQTLDAAGDVFTQAAGNPSHYKVDFDFNRRTNPGTTGRLQVTEAAKDIVTELPPGFVGNPGTLEHCMLTDLAATDPDGGPDSQCSPESQVGTVLVWNSGNQGAGGGANRLGPFPVFVMDSPPGSAARFGFKALATTVVIDAHPRTAGDYGITVGSLNTSEAVTLVGVELDFWGVPSDKSHRPQRACPSDVVPSEGGKTCPSTAQPQPFFRLPTSCPPAGTGTETTLHVDSWVDPGDFKSASVLSHEAPGYPRSPEASDPSLRWGAERGPGGCEQVPFEPSLSVDTTTNRADSPTGLSVDASIPQECWEAKATVQEAEEGLCQADLKDAKVTLPQGMSINPSAAGGLGACSSAQIGLKTAIGASPIHFDEAPVSCPDSAKIGSVEIETPLLDHPLKGDLYIAAQADNPFGSLLGLYLVVEDFQSGVTIKLAGHVLANKQNGQLETRFDENPQLPFSALHLDLFGGPRAALRTPPSCGTYTTDASFTPHSGNGAVNLASSFVISQCGSGGFDPHLAAGTQNPLAGSFSPFALRLSREDGSQELAGLRLAVPKGLVASLKDIPYCSDATLAAISGQLGTGNAQITSPSCPPASQVGTVTAGAGAGPNPFYSTTGKAYWSGPYKGAPVSLAAVVPAVAGPFDLGNVVVRNGFEVDPESAQITAVSDPFPQILHGIPLDLRDIRLNLNRPNYTLNPTSCDPLSFEADIASVGGAHAQRSQHFQAAACDRLRFKPKLSLRLRGKTNRGAHPALTATLRMPKGGANIARASVALPHSEFLDQSHIGTVCTRVQYAAGAGGGEQCPPRSIYGHARAYSPILGYYLQGPVFLRSSSHELPDLVLGLHGPPAQPIQVDAVGRIDSTKGGGIRSTFAAVPDVPVSKVVLQMRGGKKGLLQNSTNICQGTHRADATLTAHNAGVVELRPELRADCGSKARKGKKAKGKSGAYRG